MVVWEEVEKLVQKGAVSRVENITKEFFSQLFVIPKSDDCAQPVIKLKALIRFIKNKHFKKERFHMIKDLVKKGDWMAKVDLKDAYFFIPMYQAHQKFLQFQWRSDVLCANSTVSHSACPVLHKCS